MGGMNIIIPLGGLGSRFQNEGYSRPKPFVRVLGKEMIKWVIDNLTLGPDDSLVIVYNPSFMSMDVFMQEEVQNKYKNTTLVELAGPTRGAAETVLLGLQGIPEAQRKRPCMLCDGDTFYTADIVSRYREVSTTHNGTFCFSDTQPKPIYSYVTVNSADEVQDIKEKVKISDYANTGCYCFKNGCELETYCEKIIEAGAMQLSQDQKGEFYTSGVIKAMLDDGLPCKMLQLERTDLHVLGTPSQVEEFCAAWPEQPCLRFVFDLDNTLCTGPKVSGDYSTTEPIPRNIEYLKQLHAQGHYIIIATARRMRTHAGKVGAVVADVGMVTLEWLKKHEIPHDEVCFGKPWGQFYIDDLAVDALQGDLCKQIGFYPTKIPSGKPKWPNASPARKATPAAAAPAPAAGGGPLTCTWPFLAGAALALVLKQ
jgi:capsule biosynthesis phosphatase